MDSAALREKIAALKAEAESIWRRLDSIESEEIYHYTSVTAAYEILRSRVLWSSDVLSMNDGSEFKYALSTVDEVLMRRWNELPIPFAEYFRPKKLLRVGWTWNMFAACFCSEPDLLSQWRAYASNSEGVAIGFRVRPLHEIGGRLNAFGLIPIHYVSSELRDQTERMCDFALRLAPLDQMPLDDAEKFWSEVALILLNCALRFKNPSFAEEKEWRALTLHTDESPTFSRTVGSQERKYVHMPFSPDVVSQIIVGPLANGGLESRLRAYLEANGLGHVSIRRSNIPLRPNI